MGRELKRIAQEQPKTPYREYPKLLAEKMPTLTTTPSASTIQRFLSCSGYKRIKLLNKALIHPRNIAKRVKYADSHRNKSSDFWDAVIWSDETTVRSMPMKKQVYFYVHQSTKREDIPVNGQVQGGGICVMFWGCFSKMGLGPLVALEGSQNADSYIDTLEDNFIDKYLAAQDHLGLKLMFMQDNAPCHKAKKVMEFFKEYDVKLLEWPPQSPDLNPIENLWAIVKARRAKKFKIPTTRDELIDQIFDIWSNIEVELVENLADSAATRVSEVLRLQGKNTKY
jgi:transposase